MKKFVSLVLTFCLLSSFLPARAAEEPPTWAAEAYEALSARGINTGYNAGDVNPTNRGRFVQLLVRLLECTTTSQERAAYPAPANGYFADASDPLTISDLYKAAGYGFLEGTIGSDGLRYANGNDQLTREQAAKMLVSLLDFFSQTLGHTLEPSGAPAVYQDAGKISDWALPYTQTIAAYGLMKGDAAGNFDPQGALDGASAVVMVSRTLALLDEAVSAEQSALLLQTQASWSYAAVFGRGDNSVSRPRTGWSYGHYTIDNGDGTVSGLVVDSDIITVESFDADGALVSTKTLEVELPTFGMFFDSGDHFYLAFGQNNSNMDDNQEVWRIVQYDRDWNRLGSVSVNGKDSYTTVPFRSTVPRMALSADGKTVTLYAARTRYDGHQSNITILMNTAPFSVQEVMGQQYPRNHVSHSFGQFIRYDGSKMVTVDHGDAYPRSFVLQDGSRTLDLLKIYGTTGDNVTNAIGSGFEVSDSGYLFLGCSDPQDGSSGQPWNVFLAYTGKSGSGVELTWLTSSETDINTARLVKVDEDTFVAMWGEADGVHYQSLNGKGQTVSGVQVLPGALMPPTDPVVIDGDICWIQYSASRCGTFLYRLELD